MINKLRSLRYGILNLIKWFSIIWQDRDWDYWFLYKILHFKLIKMEKMFRLCGVAVSSKKEAKNIKICINLLDRLIKEDYDFSAYKNLDKKWGGISFNWEKSNNISSRLNIERENVITKKDIKQYSIEFRRCITHKDYMIKQDIKYLFDLMAKRIQYWWD